MEIITEVGNLPEDETYHTVTISKDDNGGMFTLIARNNETVYCVEVGSVSFENTVGIVDGDITLDGACSRIELALVDYREAYGYYEIEVSW